MAWPVWFVGSTQAGHLSTSRWVGYCGAYNSSLLPLVGIVGSPPKHRTSTSVPMTTLWCGLGRVSYDALRTLSACMVQSMPTRKLVLADLLGWRQSRPCLGATPNSHLAVNQNIQDTLQYRYQVSLRFSFKNKGNRVSEDFGVC
jgi:hypothetical protein